MKTQKTKLSVAAFLAGIENERRRVDAQALLKLMNETTGMGPAIWGTSLVGYGSYHYTYASGQEGDWPLTAFSPRKSNLVVYVMPGFESYSSLLAKLGKHRLGKSCLYLNRLEDIHLPTLKQLVKRSVADMLEKYPS